MLQFAGAIGDALFEFQVQFAKFIEQVFVTAFEEKCPRLACRTGPELFRTPRLEQGTVAPSPELMDSIASPCCRCR